MSHIETRSAPAAALEVRSTPIAGMDEDRREIVGIAVPWDQVTRTPGYPEKFARGAFPDGAEAVLHVNHGGVKRGEMPVGKLVGRNTDAGYEITATVARTARGDEVLQLVREGILRHLSVGFAPVAHEMRGAVVVRTKAILHEVSIAETAAYRGAVIESTRTADTEGDTRMDPEEFARMLAANTSFAEMRSTTTDLEQRVAAGLTPPPAGTPEYRCKSGGEFLQALARRDSAVIDEYRTATEAIETRAFTGQTLDADGVAVPAWIDTLLRLTNDRRPMSQLFSTRPLPAAGMSVEYPYVKTETGIVAPQAAEGDDLAYLAVQIDTATAAVGTVGGYTSLSRQLIERSNVAHLDTALRYLAIQYGEAYELKVRTFFAALLSATTGATVNKVDVATKPDTAAEWIGAVYDMAGEIEDNSKGLLADFIVCDRATAKDITLLTDSAGRPVFGFNGDGQNTWGDLSIRAQNLAGQIAGLPLVVVPKLDAGTFAVASRDAITTMESAGAPVRLQDENIINLTKDFSLYGYQAIFAEHSKGITVLDWTP